MIRTFTGFSRDGLDLAVKDAYRDMEKFCDKGGNIAEPRPIATTSNVGARSDNAEYPMEYWFTITVIFE